MEYDEKVKTKNGSKEENLIKLPAMMIKKSKTTLAAPTLTFDDQHNKTMSVRVVLRKKEEN